VIKINLLPAYVLERHLVRRTAMLMGVVILAQVSALGFALVQLGGAQQEADVRLKHWTAKANEVSTVQNQANQERSAAGPFQAWVDFVNNVHTNNAKWAWLYEEIAKWVDNKVVLRTMNASGQTVTLTGATDSLESAKRWYLNSFMCYLYADVKLQVQVPGWTAPPEGQLTAAAGVPGAAGLRFALGSAGAGRPQIGPTAAAQLTSPSERTPVTLTCSLKPQFLIIPPAPPTAGGQVIQGPGAMRLPGGPGVIPGVVPGVVGAPAPAMTTRPGGGLFRRRQRQ
jgi:hypothetical protein